MSGEYTPTTEQVRDAYVFGVLHGVSIEQRQALFTSWLDGVVAAARAEGAAAEREACAQVVLAAEWPTNAHNKRGLLDTIAAAIRGRERTEANEGD